MEALDETQLENNEVEASVSRSPDNCEKEGSKSAEPLAIRFLPCPRLGQLSIAIEALKDKTLSRPTRRPIQGVRVSSSAISEAKSPLGRFTQRARLSVCKLVCSHKRNPRLYVLRCLHNSLVAPCKHCRSSESCNSVAPFIGRRCSS